jgi:hypothetical protein
MMQCLMFLCLFSLFALPAFAGQPEAREVARINNCPPKKIDVYQNQVGRDSETVYQVTCTMPKTTDKGSANMPDALLIGCDGSLCELIRPLSLDKK